MEKIDGIKLRPGAEGKLKAAVAAKLRVRPEEIGEIRILKKSLDARKKEDVHYLYTLQVAKRGETLPPRFSSEEKRVLWKGDPVAVVGAGPCGLFCALKLAKAGVPVLLFERGDSVDRRQRAVDGFTASRLLDSESNIQFGEGGAGTFSDGKLNTRTKSPLIAEVLSTFVRYGAPEEILWENKPHIGSDRLPSVVRAMREEIVACGGKVFFRTKVTDFKAVNGKITEVTANGKPYAVSALVLAVGHSARDTFRRIFDKGCAMEQKPFAVGMRIEHLQEKIGRAQYGRAAEVLPPADYRLTSSVEGRGVYTFCMCPGGSVVAAQSAENTVVTNGMSNYLRDGKNANSALVAQVGEGEYGSGVFAGLEFQENLERSAFALGGGDYRAPLARVGDFLQGKESNALGEVSPTYPLGYRFVRPEKLLGDVLAGALRKALFDMDKKIKGFAHPDALLTGVETRTSSPVRILRGEDLQSVSFRGLYPAGEGAGYAGGITSAAVDGIRVANALLCGAEKR